MFLAFIKTANERDRCRLDVCTMGREQVLGCLAGTIATSPRRLLDHQAGSSEGWDHERASNVRPKMKITRNDFFRQEPPNVAMTALVATESVIK